MSARPPMSSTLFTLVRVVFIALTALMILAFITEVVLAPGYITSSKALNPPNITWTVETTRAALAELGWSEQGYMWLDYIRQVILGPITIGLALLLLWRKSDHWMGLYTAFVFASFGVGASPLSDALLYAVPALSGINAFLGSVSWQLGFVLFFFFPDGRFVPRWTAWVLVPWIGLNLLQVLGVSYIGSALYTWGGVVLVFTALGSQVYRYARHSDAIQRQQTKWVFFAVIVMIIVLPIGILPFLAPELFNPQGASSLLLTLLSKTGAQVGFIFFPISLEIAILRYRLWDVDVIIRRTVTYALLTGLLLITYFGSVVVLQQVFVAFTGQRSEAAIIVSTLAIAVLFVPLRNRIQSTIDHRFYRAKYNAEKVLEAFAHTARDETDLGKLSSHLVDVVDETLKPVGVTLWLHVPGDKAHAGQEHQS